MIKTARTELAEEWARSFWRFFFSKFELEGEVA
jgi:hypothetical protein